MKVETNVRHHVAFPTGLTSRIGSGSPAAAEEYAVVQHLLDDVGCDTRRVVGEAVDQGEIAQLVYQPRHAAGALVDRARPPTGRRAPGAPPAVVEPVRDIGARPSRHPSPRDGSSPRPAARTA